MHQPSPPPLPPSGEQGPPPFHAPIAGASPSAAADAPASASTTTASTSPSAWRAVDEGRVDSFVDRARQGLHCSLFCGGAKCKHENWDYFVKARAKKGSVLPPPAFEGLHSSWVTDTIVASQRPSTSLFAKHDLISQFRQSRLTGVFNLQEKGEHSSCGPDGIYPSSGYSYNGEVDLMPHGVGYYEFPWPDMTAPENDIVLRSVQVMASHIEANGRVLVHCHAGLGRTGLMIACYLVYAHRMPSRDAIMLVRANRPGAVQTAKQAAFVVGFEQYMARLANIFPAKALPGAGLAALTAAKGSKDKAKKEKSKPSSASASRTSSATPAGSAAALRGGGDPPLTLCTFINRQRAFLHGEAALPYRYVPRHLHLLMCRILELVRMGAPSEGTRPDIFGLSTLSGGGGAAFGTSFTPSVAAGGPSHSLSPSGAGAIRRSHAVALLVLGTMAHTEEDSDVSVSMASVGRVMRGLNDGSYKYGAEAADLLEPPPDATVDAVTAASAAAAAAADADAEEKGEEKGSNGDAPTSGAKKSTPTPNNGTANASNSGSGITNGYADEDHSVVTMTFVLADWLRRLEEPILFPSAIDEMAAFIAREDAALSSSMVQPMVGGTNEAIDEGSLRLPSINGASARSGASAASPPSSSSPSSPTAAYFARHFKEVERTFLRHARHTIACVLSFVQSIVLLGGLDARRRLTLIERFFDAMSLYGRAAVGRVSPETRRGALRFLGQWAEAVGPNYFFEKGAALRSMETGIGVGGVLLSSPSGAGPAVMPLPPMAAASPSVISSARAPSPSVSAAMGTGMSTGCASPIPVASPMLGFAQGPSGGDGAYCSPAEGGVAQGRIIRAVKEASVGAYRNGAGRSTSVSAAGATAVVTPTPQSVPLSFVPAPPPPRTGVEGNGQPLLPPARRSESVAVDRPDSKLENYEVTLGSTPQSRSLPGMMADD